MIILYSEKESRLPAIGPSPESFLILTMEWLPDSALGPALTLTQKDGDASADGKNKFTSTVFLVKV